MPIGDLLAEISGGQDAPAAPSSRTATVKRKAESPNRAPSKVAKAHHSDASSPTQIPRNGQRTVTAPPRSASSARPIASAPGPGPGASRDKPPSSVPSSNHSNRLPPANGQRYTGSASSAKPASGINRPAEPSNRPRPVSSASLPSKPAAAGKSSSVTPSTSDVSKTAPKKGSFAEIMARASKAQQNMGKVGLIQHKATDKPARTRERQPAPAAQKPGAKAAPAQSAYKGSARPASVPARKSPQNGSSKPTKASVRRETPPSATEAPAKKAKKAVSATSGYTGTARPAPGRSTKKAPSADRSRPSSRPGGLLAPPRAKRREEYDDYDEELDDFIDYDDDDDEPDPRQRRYEYASDGSSDMEAGMSDIDDEEQLAERAARAEDRREKELEDRLKREKEQRRRDWNRR